MKLRLSLSGELTDGLGGLPFDSIGLLRGEFILREHCESLRIPAAAEALQRYLDRVATEIVLYRIEGAEIAVLAIRHNRELGY